jgi:hypothetical protein
VLLDFAAPQVPPLPGIAALSDYMFSSPRWAASVTPFEMHIYKRINYQHAGYQLIGNIGTRDGDEQLDSEVVADWQDDLPNGAAVGQMLERS